MSHAGATLQVQRLHPLVVGLHALLVTLPADPGDLAAMVLMPVPDVARCLAICVAAGKIAQGATR